MANQQNHTHLQSEAAELTDKVSRSIGDFSQSSAINQQEPQNNKSKASSDQTQKPAALEKEHNTKMSFRKTEIDLKLKEIEIELHLLKEQCALKAKYKKETPGAGDSSFDDETLVPRLV